MKQKLICFLMILTFIFIGGYLAYFYYFAIEKPHTKLQKPETSGAMEALSFLSRLRTYPMEDIPPDKYFKEYTRSKSILRKTTRFLNNSSSWQAMGPLNVNGRMISLALNPENPSTLYAGSASGGLWRTFSAETGENWHRIPTGFPTLGVMAIAIDQADSNTIYIGTGEVYGYQSSTGGQAIRVRRGSYGVGILKTTDGGNTWFKSLDWTSNMERGVQCIRINPLNSNTLYAATSEGIYKSVDAGYSWINVLPVLMGIDIVIHPNDPDKVMVSCGNFGSEGSGLYRSLDAGINWTKLNLPDYTGKALLEMYGSNPDILFASLANSEVWDVNEEGIGLWRTNDFGSNWTNVNKKNVPQHQGWYSHWVAVHPSDTNKVIQAGAAMFKSHDGGESLEPFYVGGVDHHAYVHHPSDPNILYIAYDQGVDLIRGFGESYQKISYGLHTAQFYNGFSCSAVDSNFALGGLQDNKLVIYDGSEDWINVVRGDGTWSGINPWDDNIVYASIEYNRILKSINHGQSFFDVSSGLDGEAAFVAPFVLCPSNPSIIYTGRKKVFKSANGAADWFPANNNELDGNVILSMAVSNINSDMVYVGTAPTVTRAHLFNSSDGGDTWTDITGTLPDRYPMDIAVDPNDDQTVYVVFGGFGTGHVFKSTNGGSDWMDMSGFLPDVPALSVVVDPLNSNHVYVGNDMGVYVSRDEGEIWEPFSSGLPEVVIAMDLSISPANRTLRVATHGNGVYQRPLVHKPETLLNFVLKSIPEVHLLGMEFHFDGSVTNLGTEPFSDVYTVQLRVKDESGTEYFEDSAEIVSLGPGGNQTFSFDGAFTPPNIGIYFIEFIKLGTNLHPLYEAQKQFIRVIDPPSITRARVTKEYRSYTENQSHESSLSGDEGTEVIGLPFPFNYDGFDYDEIQISTNGWAEFGTGSMDSERGVTSSVGLSYTNSVNSSLASPAPPSKTLAPWWDDLNTGDEGIINYETRGTEPSRVFVIQWKNVQAEWKDENSARINFQIQLNETSNIIEYHYGHMVAGTFSGSTAGASIGFKDHIGGEYHFFDVVAGGTGRAADLITSLSPLTDWPGPDSCFMIDTSPSQNIIWQTLNSGTDNQLIVVDALTDRIAWTGGLNGTVLRTDDGGNTWTDVWGLDDTSSIYNIEGLDGDIAFVSVRSADSSTTYIYKTDNGGLTWQRVYEQAGGFIDDITMHTPIYGTAVGDPVEGFWTILKTIDGGNTWTPIPNAPAAQENEFGWRNGVTWVDESTGWIGTNNSRVLYTQDDGMSWSDSQISSLPDVRAIAFNQAGTGIAVSWTGELARSIDKGKSWEGVPSPLHGNTSYVFSEADVFWLIIDNSIFISTNHGFNWELETSASTNLNHLDLIPNDQGMFGLAVGDNGMVLHYFNDKIMTQVRDEIFIPKQFVLYQNYPNPFNPITTIKYEIPEPVDVEIRIYDILGRFVYRLVNEHQQPGQYEYKWNGLSVTNNYVSSGIYMYQIKAGTYTHTKKMVYVK